MAASKQFPAMSSTQYYPMTRRNHVLTRGDLNFCHEPLYSLAIEEEIWQQHLHQSTCHLDAKSDSMFSSNLCCTDKWTLREHARNVSRSASQRPHRCTCHLGARSGSLVSCNLYHSDKPLIQTGQGGRRDGCDPSQEGCAFGFGRTSCSSLLFAAVVNAHAEDCGCHCCYLGCEKGMGGDMSDPHKAVHQVERLLHRPTPWYFA